MPRAHHFGMLIGMSSTQIAVRLPDDLLTRVDELVARGEAESRADAVRIALAALVRASESRRDGALIAAGYRRHPVGEPDDWGDLDALLDWGTAATLSDLERQERDAGVEGW